MCIFADSCDVPAAQQVLLDLPPDAYGQVYVADGTVPLGAPERVQVNWLTSRPGQCALAEAMAGWAAEWLPDCAASAEPSPTVWVLPGATATLAASEHECVTRLLTALPSDQLIHG